MKRARSPTDRFKEDVAQLHKKSIYKLSDLQRWKAGELAMMRREVIGLLHPFLNADCNVDRCTLDGKHVHDPKDLSRIELLDRQFHLFCLHCHGHDAIHRVDDCTGLWHPLPEFLSKGRMFAVDTRKLFAHLAAVVQRAEDSETKRGDAVRGSKDFMITVSPPAPSACPVDDHLAPPLESPDSSALPTKSLEIVGEKARSLQSPTDFLAESRPAVVVDSKTSPGAESSSPAERLSSESRPLADSNTSSPQFPSQTTTTDPVAVASGPSLLFPVAQPKGFSKRRQFLEPPPRSAWWGLSHLSPQKEGSRPASSIATPARRECFLCFTPLEESKMPRKFLSCDHEFHVPCIDWWLTQPAARNRCPRCLREHDQAKVDEFDRALEECCIRVREQKAREKQQKQQRE